MLSGGFKWQNEGIVVKKDGWKILHKTVFIGDKFGKLKIITDLGRCKGGRQLVECLCDCGNLKKTYLSYLYTGVTSSCGCLVKRNVEIGQRYKNMVIVKDLGDEIEGTHKRRYVACRCDCGVYFKIRYDAMCHSVGCWCARISKTPFEYNYREWKGKAERRNIKFNLTMEEFIKLCETNCYFCNSNPRRKGRRLAKITGIDRLDSDKDYDIENCVSCCTKCNFMKKWFSENYFLNKIVKIYNKSILNVSHENTYSIKIKWEKSYKSFNKSITKWTNKDISLTLEEYIKLSLDNCYYCDLAAEDNKYMTKNKKSKSGIDRVDSSKSYEISNCVSCCKDCNYMKGLLSKEDFIEQVKIIYDFKNLAVENVVEQNLLK